MCHSRTLNNINRLHHRGLRLIYRDETLRFLGPKVWDIIPRGIKEASCLTISKNKIKYWIPEDCPFKLCKDYIQWLGCLNNLIHPSYITHEED